VTTLLLPRARKKRRIGLRRGKRVRLKKNCSSFVRGIGRGKTNLSLFGGGGEPSWKEGRWTDCLVGASLERSSGALRSRGPRRRKRKYFLEEGFAYRGGGEEKSIAFSSPRKRSKKRREPPFFISLKGRQYARGRGARRTGKGNAASLCKPQRN